MNRIDPKLAATLRQPAELIARGLAPTADIADLERVAARYAIAVTPDIADLIDSENPDDPIARQFESREKNAQRLCLITQLNRPYVDELKSYLQESKSFQAAHLPVRPRWT